MLRGRSSGWLLAGALALGVAAPAPGGGAMAQESAAELAAARQLFKEGKELEAASSWAEALEKFKKVAEVKMTPQVRFHIALCEENLGRLVAAINGFELAAEEAARPGANAADVVENAPVRAEALRKRVPRLRFEVKGRLTTSRILLDGAKVAAALVGTEIPVDPGKHVIDVETAGEVVMHKELDLAEKAVETVVVAVDDADAPPAPAPAPTAAARAAAPPVVEPAAEPSKLPAIAVGAIGVGAFIGAGVFLGLRDSTIAEVADTCDAEGARCDPGKAEVAARGQTYTTVANVLTGVGAAGLAGAAILWLFVLTPGKADPAPKIGVAPTASGLEVFGSF